MTETVEQLPEVTEPATKAVDLEAELGKQQRKIKKEQDKGAILNRSLELKNTVRMAFSQEMNKLDTLETRETALRAIKTLFDGNRNKEALKLFLMILATPKTQTAKGRCAELKVVRLLLKLFAEMLLAGTGGGLNRVYTILLSFFSDRSREVQESVAACLCDLYTCSLPLGPGKSTKFIIEPLSLVLMSGGGAAQQTAAVALRTWICSLPVEQTAILNDAAKKVVELFLKLKPGYPDLISALGYLVQHFGMNQLLPDLLILVKKTLEYFGQGSQSGHFGEKEACKLLGEIHRRLGSAVTGLGDLKREVIARLKDAKTHKVAEVQREAAAAYMLWTGGHAASPARPALTRLRTVRDAIKREKTKEPSPPPDDQWGVYRPKYLTRGSGRYVPPLGYGRLDLTKALKSRPSIRDFIKSKGKSATGKIEILVKSPTEASRIVPRNGFDEGQSEMSMEDPETVQLEEEVKSVPQAEDVKVVENASEDLKQSIEKEGKESEESEEGKEEEEKIGTEEPATDTGFQPFEVEAPVQATETANPGRQWNRMKTTAKKTEPEIPVEPPPDPEAPPSERHSSGQSSSKFRKAVGRSSLLRKLGLAGQERAARNSSGPETAEVQTPTVEVSASPKFNSLMLFGALGKSVLGKLNSSKSVQELISPPSSAVESQLSAPTALLEELVMSPIHQLSRKATLRSPTAVAEQEESQEISEGEEDRETAEIVVWLDKVMAGAIDQMDVQFQRMSEVLSEMDERLSRLEGETAYQLQRYRARNAAPPKYKSRIHPPQLSPATMTHTTTQTHPFTRDNLTQTIPIKPSKKPAIDSLTLTWIRAQANLRNPQQVYRRVLRTGDDLYLIRLLMTTGVVLGQLNLMTVGTLFDRLSGLISQSYVKGVMMDWIEGSAQTGLFYEMGREEQQSMLQMIETVGLEETEDGLKARSLYEYLTSE